ncbi:lysine-specific demethylase 5D isoform X1, partial [Tanacetum coccineum]
VLVCVEKDGSLLKVQVDELLLVDVELKKASCRVEAWKVLHSKTPLESVHQKKAKQLLSCEVQMSEFEDVVRMSEDLSAVIPTLDAVKGVLSVAKSSMRSNHGFNAMGDYAYSELDDAESLFNILDVSDEISSDLIFQITNHVATMESITKAEFTHRYDSLVLVKSGNLEVVFPDVSYEYSALVEKLWKDEGFQATFARLDEFSTLPMVVEYFLSRAVEISSMTYEPSDEDILYADGITISNGLASMEYSVPSTLPVTFMDTTEQNHAPLQRLFSSVLIDAFVFYGTIITHEEKVVACDAESDSDLFKAFEMFDKNRDGFICNEELMEALTRLGLWDDKSNMDVESDDDVPRVITVLYVTLRKHLWCGNDEQERLWSFKFFFSVLDMVVGVHLNMKVIRLREGLSCPATFLKLAGRSCAVISASALRLILEYHGLLPCGICGGITFIAFVYLVFAQVKAVH